MVKRKASSEPPSSISSGKRPKRDIDSSDKDRTELLNNLDATSASESESFPEISPEEITVAVFCALSYEAVAVKYTLDEEYTCHPRSIGPQKYVFSYGRIKHHKVVIARPHYMGTVQAAHCASAVRQQFPNVQFALMVGIGAGIPDLPRRDIRLGDVAVSIPKDNHPGVIQYDYGKYELGGFIQKGPLNKPPGILVSADGSLEEDEEMGKTRHLRFLRRIAKKNPRYRRPETSEILFDPTFHHVSKGAGCVECEASCDLHRMSRSKARQPQVHRGLILSGGEVVKHPHDLERLRRNHKNAICFEMEAAGIMDELPCLVIRGICDYADTHKQDGWHRYASAVAAAYCKAVLLKVPEHKNEENRAIRRLTDTVERLSNQLRYIHERVYLLEQGVNKAPHDRIKSQVSNLEKDEVKKEFSSDREDKSFEENRITRVYNFYGPVTLAEHATSQEQKNV